MAINIIRSGKWINGLFKNVMKGLKIVYTFFGSSFPQSVGGNPRSKKRKDSGQAGMTAYVSML